MDGVKKYHLERSLHPRSDFAKVVGIKTPTTLESLLLKAHAYIQYEEKEAANNARDSQHHENSNVSKNDEPSTSLRGG